MDPLQAFHEQHSDFANVVHLDVLEPSNTYNLTQHTHICTAYRIYAFLWQEPTFPTSLSLQRIAILQVGQLNRSNQFTNFRGRRFGIMDRDGKFLVSEFKITFSYTTFRAEASTTFHVS